MIYHCAVSLEITEDHSTPASRVVFKIFFLNLEMSFFIDSLINTLFFFLKSQHMHVQNVLLYNCLESFYVLFENFTYNFSFAYYLRKVHSCLLAVGEDRPRS